MIIPRFSVIATCLLMFILWIGSYAQTISTLESLSLPLDSFYNGSNSLEGASFTDEDVIYPNQYNRDFGGYWSGGWAYSTKIDSVSAGFTNLYSARTASGYNSSTYAVGQQSSKIYFKTGSDKILIEGLYVTNGTYPALSMLRGDDFAKKFGGVSGNDSDWFKLSIQAWREGQLLDKLVEVYLADYRFEESAQDYILKEWQWVDLSMFGIVDSLEFKLSSSDVGDFGMNTPGFFCIDDLTYFVLKSNSIDQTTKSSPFKIIPNPASDQIFIQSGDEVYPWIKVEVFNTLGQKIANTMMYDQDVSFDIHFMPNGFYKLVITTETGQFLHKLMIQK